MIYAKDDTALTSGITYTETYDSTQTKITYLQALETPFQDELFIQNTDERGMLKFIFTPPASTAKLEISMNPLKV